MNNSKGREVREVRDDPSLEVKSEEEDAFDR